MRLRAMALLVCCLLGCDGGREDAALEEAAVDSTVAVAEREGRVLRANVAGRALTLMVDDCKVYEVTHGPGNVAQHGEPVLRTDWYPAPTVCSPDASRGQGVCDRDARTNGDGCGRMLRGRRFYRSRDGRA